MSTSDDVLVGRYRLIQQIGAGGMGVVWRAYDERLGRDVAVKRLLAGGGLAEADAQVASHRAMREARITARLHHPHAVPVFDVIEDRGRPCLVMQYFPSSSLAELVAGGRTLPVPQVARIGFEVASALAAAHEVGIVHRDVKPANVLVAPDGAAKISDFGISHALGDVSLTSTGLVTGTPAYLAPEVARGEDSTPASDVFSLGSTLYTVLEGTAPFGMSENPMALLHRVASGEVEPPRRSGALTALLLSMLAGRPEDRPTMAQVARQLSRPAEALAPLAVTVPLTIPQPAPARLAASAAPDPEPHDEDLLWAFRDQEPPLRQAPPDADPVPRRRRGLLVVLAVAAVVAAGIALVSRQADAPAGSPTGSAVGRASTGPSPASSTTSPSPPVPTTTAPTTTAPSRTATPTGGGTPSVPELKAAVQGYYALLPADLDTGWARLTDHYQRTTARSRDTYASFWGAVDRVSVSDVTASAPGSVTATVTYEYADGRVFVERTSYALVRQDGTLRIDRSNVVSSTQR